MKGYQLIILLLLGGALLVASYVFFINFNSPWQHFSDQAQSFANGRLDLDPNPYDKHDYVVKDGKYYWPEGPYPSLLLVPFQLFLGSTFHQGSMQFVLIVVLSSMLFQLAKLKGFDLLDSFYLTSVFLLGSTVVGLILDPKSWFFAQIIATTYLAGLILELETLRRWYILGILGGALIATRPTAGFIIFALLFLVYKEKVPFKKRLWNFTSLLSPIITTGLALLWFNYARFGNPLDNGYLNNEVGGFISPLRDLGLFSLTHIPTNFYYYFLASVEPVSDISVHLRFPFIKYSVWGLSIILVAPFFLNCLRTLKKSSTFLRSLWVVILTTLLVQLSYYAPGWYQFGPRYTADFMPIIYLLTLYSFNIPKLTKYHKLLITLSCLFNIYLLFTHEL